MRSAATLTILLLTTTTARAAFNIPSLMMRRTPMPRASSPAMLKQDPLPPKIDASKLASGTAPPAKGFRVPKAWILPTVSYSSLAFTVAGAIKLIGATTTSFALMGWTVALPVGLAVWSCSQGGAKVAQQMGGQPADETLTAYAREAADAVGVAPPELVFQIPASEPNAFAASNLLAGSTTVAVTSGLRAALTPDELKAVLAHEMGHLQSNDVVRNMHISVAAAGLGGVYDAGRMLLDSSSRKRRSSSSKKDKDEGSGAGVGLALMAAGLATQTAAHLLRLSASRTMEFQADAAAARAYGADTMISALQKIDRSARRAPADLRESKAAAAYAFAMISDGASADAEPAGALMARRAKPSAKEAGGFRGMMTKVGNALRTHPPLTERVAALEEAAETGSVPVSLPARGGRSGFGLF